MLFAGLQAGGVGGSENRRNVIIGFHFILMPGSHNDRQNPNWPLGLRRGSPGLGLRGSAMPGVEHGTASTTRTRNPGDAERESGAKNSPVRSCPELRKWTNEPGAHQVARNA